MPASTDATPIAITGQPAIAARYAPQSVASPNATTMPRFICAAVSSPLATARVGPSRAGPSAPFSASNTSFAKLVPIWIQNAPKSAASAGPSANPPTAYATAVPTATGAAAAVKVAGRAARIQVFTEISG